MDKTTVFFLNKVSPQKLRNMEIKIPFIFGLKKYGNYNFRRKKHRVLKTKLGQLGGPALKFGR